MSDESDAEVGDVPEVDEPSVRLDFEVDSDDDDEQGRVVSDVEEELDEGGNKVEYEADPDFVKKERRKQLVDQLHESRAKQNIAKRQCLDLTTINNIRYKSLRRREMQKYERVMKKKKKEERKKRKRLGIEPTEAKTIENTREPDATTVGDLEDEDNAEVAQDFATDEFSDYFKASYEPKVLVTFSDSVHTKTREFGHELCLNIPNSTFRYRNRSSVKKMVRLSGEQGYTDIVIINENRREPNGMVVIHLPDGPTAHFRLSNVKTLHTLAKMKKRFPHKAITHHRPEVILNNFGTRLGNTVARMLAALFHYEPEFKGRRAVTFHNQRDYIFFRSHRYEFKSDKKVALRELGPRFTLRLRSLQNGTFDSKTGEYEWLLTGRRHEMEVNRRTFFL